MDVSPPTAFTIIHFNDVYNIQRTEDYPGVTNFEAYLRQVKAEFPGSLILFSGDAFSPSSLSKVYEGEQMVNCLNKLGIHASVFGNHEFDFDPDQNAKLVKDSNFPWILGNVTYIDDPNRLLGDSSAYITKEVNGKKIGVFGVAGPDWMAILSGEYEDALAYKDYVEYSTEMAAKLRDVEKCDFVVALCHLLQDDDKNLAAKVDGVDLVLGGHDHMILNTLVNETPVIKSGDDFNNLGVIKIYEKNKNENSNCKGRRYDFDVDIRKVPEMPPESYDKDLDSMVTKYQEDYLKNDRVVGACDVPLDTTEETIRDKESRYGNFLADLVRLFFNADIGTVNSGSIRSSVINEPYEVRFLFVDGLFDGPLIVKEITGKVLKEVLENSCKSCPGGLSGAFLAVSGVQYHYDYTKTPRVQYVAVNGQPVEDDKIYKFATTEYVANGGDGYDVLKDCKTLIDAEHSIHLENLILKFFKAECIQTAEKREKLIEHHKLQSETGYPEFPPQYLKLKNQPPKVKRMRQLVKRIVLGPDGKLYLMISPQIEGRIKCLNA